MISSEYAGRPHTCPANDGLMVGHADLSFASHDALAFHIIRHHLVRAHDIPSCRRTCPMLTENIRDAARR